MPPRLKRSLLVGASGLALAIGSAIAPAAFAFDECGAANAGDTVTCSAAGNNFPNGITYLVIDLTVVVEDGVVIDTTGAAGEQGGIVSNGVAFIGNQVVKAGTDGGAGVTITTDEVLADGIYSHSGTGSVAITFFGAISTAGDQARGIDVLGAVAPVVVVTDGSIATKGYDSAGIYAFGQGPVAVTLTGAISTVGDKSYGIRANSLSDAVTVTSTGDISTEGYGSLGIKAFNNNDATTVTSVGDVSTEGDFASAILGVSKDGAVTINSVGDLTTVGKFGTGASALSTSGAVAVTSNGNISTAGYRADGLYGYAGAATVSITSVGDVGTKGDSARGIATRSKYAAIISSTGAISTEGDKAFGVFAFSIVDSVAVTSKGDVATKGAESGGIVALSGDDVSISTTGDITTEGIAAEGILAQSIAGGIIISSTGEIATLGDQSEAISAYSQADAVSVTSVGKISTAGFNAVGIFGHSKDGTVAITTAGAITTAQNLAFGISAEAGENVVIDSVGAVRTAGAGATGVNAEAVGDGAIEVETVIATGNGANAIEVQVGGAATIRIFDSVQGGVGAAGLDLEAVAPSSVDIAAGAALGALSDRAILDHDGTLTIANRGTIAGFFSLGGGADTFDNLSVNSFDLRAFADTDGDLARDTESVAVADFGAGADTLNNVGTLRLATVNGAATVNTAGQLAHPGGGNADIAQQGVEQGFLANLELFTNSGRVTLQDGVAGDLLAITDAAAPGGGGANEFRSEGGSLALDVVLDDGSSQQSDMLVLDNATTGSGGATHVFIADAGGGGGQTIGDGIQIINVDGASSPDAFALAAPAIAGGYQYDLFFQNEAKSDQNWFLRSSLYQGAFDYPAIVVGALETWYADLDSLHQRLGEVRRQVEDGQTAALNTATDMADSGTVRRNDSGQAGWFKVTGSDLEIEQGGPADFELNTVRAEAGFDVGFDNLVDSGDWLVLGGFAGYGWSSLGFENAAEIDFDIATVGAYATYFRGPYYLDALVKLDWLDGTYNSQAVTDDGDVALPVFGLSLETGYRVDLTWNSNGGGLYLQPQAQLSYAHAGADSFKDDSGAIIALDDADSLRGRLGVRLGQELPSAGGAAKGNFYLEASVNQEFLGESQVTVSGLTFDQELPDTTFEIGGGFDIALPEDGVTFSIDAGYTFGDDVDGIGATGGIRINW